MNLAQMIATVNSKSYNSRPDDVIPAISEGGWKVFSAVVKEFAGFFLKVDSATVTLTPGQQQYAMPIDLGNLIAIGERQNISENWREILPTTPQEAFDRIQIGNIWDGWFGECSHFRFFGPFMGAVANNIPAPQQIQITPAVDTDRQCQLVYTAKYLPLTNPNSLLSLPDEGTYAQQSFAIAEVLRANNDALAGDYQAKGKDQLTDFLTWVRDRQTVERPQITGYLED
jgi:hypothetical protein